MSDGLTLDVFEAFPKIPRLNRTITITEKIDGTNAQVCVLEDGRVLAGSRNKWITPEDDNYGFAGWVRDHADELRAGLGVGRHFGEWWGQGIQRKYDMKRKAFSLFNVSAWKKGHSYAVPPRFPEAAEAPACCDVVPVLYHGPFSQAEIESALQTLRINGSVAGCGFDKPEGIIVYHAAMGGYFKVTLEKDAEHKGQAGRAA